jgi:hypothetical protein
MIPTAANLTELRPSFGLAGWGVPSQLGFLQALISQIAQFSFVGRNP